MLLYQSICQEYDTLRQRLLINQFRLFLLVKPCTYSKSLVGFCVTHKDSDFCPLLGPLSNSTLFIFIKLFSQDKKIFQWVSTFNLCNKYINGFSSDFFRFTNRCEKLFSYIQQHALQQRHNMQPKVILHALVHLDGSARRIKQYLELNKEKQKYKLL
jgi:hypothetical protein